MSNDKWPWNLSDAEFQEAVEALRASNPQADRAIREIAALGLEAASTPLATPGELDYDPLNVPYMLGKGRHDERRRA